METLMQSDYETNLLTAASDEQPYTASTERHHKKIPVSSRKGKIEETFQCKYDARLAEAALRQASSSGFLVSPSKHLILKVANR